MTTIITNKSFFEDMVKYKNNEYMQSDILVEYYDQGVFTKFSGTPEIVYDSNEILFNDTGENSFILRRQ